MNNFEIFSGPCVLESENLAIEIAGSVLEQLKPFKNISYAFKEVLIRPIDHLLRLIEDQELKKVCKF